jgi:hypothetical protein
MPGGAGACRKNEEEPMKRFINVAIFAPVLALALIGTAVGAAETDATKGGTPKTDSGKTDSGYPPGRAVINFANLPHRIDSWQADGTKGVYLRIAHRKWYYATFMGPCNNLPFVEAIGIVTDGTRQVDHFSSIVVSGLNHVDRCWFKTVDEVSGPPKKSKKKDEAAAK